MVDDEVVGSVVEGDEMSDVVLPAGPVTVVVVARDSVVVVDSDVPAAHAAAMTTSTIAQPFGTTDGSVRRRCDCTDTHSPLPEVFERVIRCGACS